MYTSTLLHMCARTHLLPTGWQILGCSCHALRPVSDLPLKPTSDWLLCCSWWLVVSMLQLQCLVGHQTVVRMMPVISRGPVSVCPCREPEWQKPTEHFIIIMIIMDICKTPTLWLKVLNKHNMIHIMCIKMENVISNLKTNMQCRHQQGFKPVSYTHLTLPTSVYV